MEHLYHMSAGRMPCTARNGLSISMALAAIGLVLLVSAFTVLSGFIDVSGNLFGITEDKQKQYGEGLETATDEASKTSGWSEDTGPDQSTDETDNGPPGEESIVPDGGTYEAIS